MSMLMTVAEVAQRLNCTPPTVRALVHAGKLRAVTLVGESNPHYRFTPEEISRFIQEGMEGDATTDQSRRGLD